MVLYILMDCHHYLLHRHSSLTATAQTSKAEEFISLPVLVFLHSQTRHLSHVLLAISLVPQVVMMTVAVFSSLLRKYPHNFIISSNRAGLFHAGAMAGDLVAISILSLLCSDVQTPFSMPVPVSVLKLSASLSEQPIQTFS